MDMPGSDSSDNSTMSMGSMKMYLHFTPGDFVLFQSLVPSSAGAVVGTCLFFFFLSIFDRWFVAFRRRATAGFDKRSSRLVNDFSSDTNNLLPKNNVSSLSTKTPFILSHELARGVLTGVSVTLHYLLMLVVMTFNASFIISIILGAVVGDVAFGRL